MGYEYIIIIALVLILTGYIIYKNKQVPEVFQNVRDFAISRIEDNKTTIIIKSYDELPISIKSKVDRETYKKLGGKLFEYALNEIKKDLLKP